MTRLRIVELNVAELARAADCARRRNRPGLNPLDTPSDPRPEVRRFADGSHDDLARNELGAQGELALGKLIGITAPLHADTFHNFPDVPPNWSVKTQLSTSKDMLDRYMRLRRRDFQRDYRHVLIERDIALDGHFVFVVHGWIPNEQAEAVAVRRYAYSDNRFVHTRHLQPIEPLCQLDEDYWAERADRWYFDDSGILQMREVLPLPRARSPVELSARELFG